MTLIASRNATRLQTPRRLPPRFVQRPSNPTLTRGLLLFSRPASLLKANTSTPSVSSSMNTDVVATPQLAMFGNASNTTLTGCSLIQVYNAGDRTWSRHQIITTIFKDHIASNASHDSNERADPPQCHPGTRMATIDRLKDWVTREGSTSVLWLFGTAGAGKTAIARSLARLLKGLDLLAASFFFFRTSPKRNSAELFISTIAYQLAINTPEIQPYILDVLDRDPSIFQKSTESQFQSLIINPISQLPSTAHPRTFSFIIDGLDECLDRAEQDTIINVICNALQPAIRHIKFLIISRPEHHIECAFEKLASSSCFQRIDLVRDFNASGDLRKFILDKFRDIKRTHPSRGAIDESWPSESTVDTLVRNADFSNFLYARVVMDFMEATYDSPQERLKVILGLQPTGAENPYHRLDEVYRYILSSVRADIGPILKMLAIAIVAAKAEMLVYHKPYNTQDLLQSAPFLEIVLGIVPGTIQAWLVDLRSLIILQNYEDETHSALSPEIQFMHRSLMEFLLDPSRSQGYCLNQTQAFLDIASGCLNALSVENVQAVLSRLNWYPLIFVLAD
ncbi:unnamed protein product [Cyclocybe aegerita]|uniref:NACHT domain-containing protein n=1 Tax=Cyclocybe aegerita TaxID=1973307 RepID=A0A8S0WV40_CYCAE|nr:unnamed protein product [Cyclocybe aegerita]